MLIMQAKWLHLGLFGSDLFQNNLYRGRNQLGFGSLPMLFGVQPKI